MGRASRDATDATNATNAGEPGLPRKGKKKPRAEEPVSSENPAAPPDPPSAPPRSARPPRDFHRLLALGVAALFLFTMLGKSGIWDPYELDAADLARRIAVNVFGAKGLELPGGANTLPTLTDLKMGELPFTSMALGFSALGLHDWTGRLPLAVWAFAAVWILYELLARLVDRRAGLYAAVALVTMPLFFIQARTMLGDAVAISALTIAFSGLVGALLDDGRRLLWALIGAVGLAAGYMSRGAILGVAVPALAVGLTWVIVRLSEDPRPERASSPDADPRDLVGAVTLIVGLSAAFIGVRALLRATPDLPLARTVGFLIQRRAGTDATFDLTIRQLGHALFPWSAFIPFALGRVLRPPVEASSENGARERETGVRIALVVASAITYGAFALLAPKAGNLPFTGPALFAAAIGITVLDGERGAPPSRTIALAAAVLAVVIFFDLYREQDKALAAFVIDKPQFPKSFEADGQRLLKIVLVSFVGLTTFAWIEAQPRRLPSFGEWGPRILQGYRDLTAELGAIWNGNLLFSLVVIEAALVGLGAMIVIGRRVAWAPVDKLPENWVSIGTAAWGVLPAVLAFVPLAVMLGRDGFRAAVAGVRLPRATFTLAGALIAGGTLSFKYFPDVAAQLSPKEAFESYARLSHGGEPLALLSVRSRSAAYYGGGEAPSFTDANQAFSWLTDAKDGRRWLLLKADDLPRLNALYRGLYEKNLPVLDGRSSQILLASNQLGDHANENALGKLVLDEPPSPVHRVDATFEDQLTTIGWDVTDTDGKRVDSVVPSKTYRLRTYYRVLKPMQQTWKLFVHIDGFQRRFNGDHNVLDGKYGMNFWRPGDVVVDDFEFALEPNFTPGAYTLFYGFFTGDTRFKVTKGPAQDNRIIAGPIEVR